MGCESSMEVKARADGGDREAQYKYGYYHTDDTSQSIKYLKMAGEQDHKKAANVLGYLYHDNDMNINFRQYLAYKNDVEANKWYRIAGDLRGIELTQNAIDCRNRAIAEQEQKRDHKEQVEQKLRDTIERDERMLRDHKEQVERELKDGSKESLYKIGMVHITGHLKKVDHNMYDPLQNGIDGIDIDHKEGIKHLIMSAKQEHEEAANQLGYIYGYRKLSSGTKVEVDTDMRKSYEYFKMAGNTEEMSKIATILSVENQTDAPLSCNAIDAPPSYDEANV